MLLHLNYLTLYLRYEKDLDTVLSLLGILTEDDSGSGLSSLVDISVTSVSVETSLTSVSVSGVESGFVSDLSD